jgi:hypothetical protein
LQLPPEERVFWKSKLEKALSSWLRDGGSLQQKLPRGDDRARTEGEARLVCAAIDKALSVSPIEQYKEPSYNLHAAIALFQSVETDEAAALLRKQGLPRLRALIRRYFEHHDVDADTIVFVAKILALYNDPADVELVLRLARDSECESRYLWSMIFKEFVTRGSNVDRVVAGLRHPLPRGYCGIAFLDFCNQAAIAGSLANHPFDAPEGYTLLHGWLASADETRFSYAISTTAALPFLESARAAELAAVAARHPDVNVQMESAWADAKLGRDAGLERLISFARDPLHAHRAVRYLEDLGHAGLVPEQARTPDARALAEMAQWLAHPNELGRAPDAVSIADTRELYWPPTNDQRQLWVIRYVHRDGDSGRIEDFGLVGSTTWAMMSEESRVGDPLDVYAIHCCWELEANDDPRAPPERSVAAGRRILAERNPEFRLREV